MNETRVLTLWNDGVVNEDDAAVLRRRCEELPIPFDAAAREAVRALREAFLGRDDASGLAAPQIGISKRIIAFRNRGFTSDGAVDGTWSKKDVEILVNPRITQTRGDLVVLSEGCLSCPDVRVQIARFPEIKVRGYDMFGQKVSRRYFDYVARIVQHEMDHLDGKLIVDYEGAVLVPKKKRNLFESLLART
ncbi:MAG TPA: peptide deformylase [Syntrophales bacterium]|nr:peptide deformylase [Syntrophales bacterium]HOM06299.1 peptide deformylase [Syntrophales bacterium]HON99262.1 peptide deformylase [Syntrophales bacterium]HPC00087.1 peptide deformylase [Syntrophales bacterium]HPQ05720.1 peptide deformylase [Syntrophales bacterium]